MKTMVSIIIPAKKIDTCLLQETIPAIQKQTYKNFEVIVIPDKDGKKEKLLSFVKIVSSWPKVGPADKRDLGVKKAKGNIFAFTDADVYPDKDWLKKAVVHFKNPEIAGVCGPGLTPPDDNLRQKVSGWVWSSWLGSGGAGTYRCSPGKKRFVDDYPTFNLFVRREDFKKINGFRSHFWPGEDTKFCLNLVYKLGKRIIYDSEVLVYHHRREIFLPHLKQIAAYGLHRGHFARILPKTSLRLGYLMPSFFVLGLVIGFFLALINPFFKAVYLTVLGMYLTALILTAFQVFWQGKNSKVAFLVMPAIFLTHLFYGTLFIKGFLSPKLKR